MKHMVFEPFIGSSYKQGLQDGKLPLVLGHSHDCPYKDELCFKKCTLSVNGCEKLKLDCPHMDEIQETFPNNWKDKGLSLNTKCEIQRFLDGIDRKAYSKFSEFMCKYFNLSKESFWNKIAFYNYVQYFLPQKSADISWITKDKENDLAFEEMLTGLPARPDVIIAWGKVGKHLYDLYQGKYLDVMNNLDDKYLYTISLLGKSYIVLNTCHPSAHDWTEGEKLINYMNYVFPNIKSESNEEE
ncbi:hypothetical protein H6B13_07730 [Bacteroides gallinaceum]|uniref:hypothetical protein n=1 Tax=Bacteroides gallinaceum TaxID=1462571 RepID=UPI001956FB9F|nr:hypothetical protein [Bacteroides gallinaceum]MBM6719532.1 hypothetical protein [Bacteroides gallinaceum]